MNPIILDATTKSITIVLGGAVSTNQCGVVSSWADNTGTVFTEGSTDVLTNSTTPVTIVASPGASTRRIVKSIIVQNNDTAAVTATITYVSTGGSRVLATVTLAIGDTWTTDGTYDTNGNLKTTQGVVSLTANVSGILPVANGGTGLATLTTNSYYKGNGTSAPTARTYSEVLTDIAALPLAGGTMTGKVVGAGRTEVGKTYTPSSGSQTVALDCSVNNMHIVSGNASGTAITFTITGATNSQCFVVSILQGGTTVSTITAWFATVRWAGGVAPTLTATLNKRDTFGFIRTGTDTYDGFVIGQNA